MSIDWQAFLRGDEDYVKRPLAVLCDLDSTLCDTAHRRELVPERVAGGGAEAWAAYSAACAGDGLISATANLLALLRHPTVLLTGRNESARPQTEAWLAHHRIEYEELVMRPDDGGGLSNWKRDAIADLKARWEFAVALDDWPPGARVSEEMGIPTLVVANAWNPDAVEHMLGELRA